MRCESGGNPAAVGTEMIDGVTYTFIGLFQVLAGPTDPLENARAAHRQYAQWVNGQRARPWPNCP